MKSGMASIVKDCVVEKAFCTRIVQGKPGVSTKKNKPDNPIENATGMPRNKSTINRRIA
jgi:hypothetical protein